jgi:hypothetical protein
LIEEMVVTAVARMKLQDGRMRRGQHAKATGCVRGVFTIRDDAPEDLRYGVFRQPEQSFQAVVRFSNSAETMDSDKTVAARGMAIKLLDVGGNNIGETGATALAGGWAAGWVGAGWQAAAAAG